jgi:hypothetical protein
MTNSEIRKAIAESGKMRVTEVVNYFKSRYPGADIKTVKSEAKDMISEAKKYM